MNICRNIIRNIIGDGGKQLFQEYLMNITNDLYYTSQDMPNNLNFYQILLWQKKRRLLLQIKDYIYDLPEGDTLEELLQVLCVIKDEFQDIYPSFMLPEADTIIHLNGYVI